ncbi:hypothetical protein G6F42_024664 [Rhizopus arrhizus]|nr:hypothetical protein G6F42_024664 [Rhizopus arrhizus]
MVRIAQKKHQLIQPKQDTVWYDWLSHVKDQQMELSLERQVVQVQEALGEIDALDKEIARLRDVNRSPEYYMPTGAAFVTFKSAHSAQICAQIVTSWKPGVFDTRMAPEPRDVLWRSLLRRGRKSRVTGTLRQWVVLAAVCAIFYTEYPANAISDTVYELVAVDCVGQVCSPCMLSTETNMHAQKSQNSKILYRTRNLRILSWVDTITLPFSMY